jgi:hypothetical protein
MAIDKTARSKAAKRDIKSLSKTFQVRQVIAPVSREDRRRRDDGGRTCGATRSRCSGAEMEAVFIRGGKINPSRRKF